MNKFEERTAVMLSWQEISLYIHQEIQKILGRSIVCDASADSYDYWSVGFPFSRMPVSEVCKLIEEMKLTPEESKYAFPDDDDDEEPRDSVNSIDMALSVALLKAGLPFEWETWFLTDDYLLLIKNGEKTSTTRTVRINDAEIDFNELKSRNELMNYLVEHGPNRALLHEFCEDYRKKYRSKLYWQLPISDSDSLGTYLVLVREGVLSLPYDDADKVSGEIFSLDKVRMFRSDDMYDRLNCWQQIDSELQNAMLSMLTYLERQEKTDGTI